MPTVLKPEWAFSDRAHRSLINAHGILLLHPLEMSYSAPLGCALLTPLCEDKPGQMPALPAPRVSWENPALNESTRLFNLI